MAYPASLNKLSTAQAEMSYVRSEGEYRHAVSCFQRVKRLLFVVKLPGRPKKSPKNAGDQWINLINMMNMFHLFLKKIALPSIVQVTRSDLMGSL